MYTHQWANFPPCARSVRIFHLAVVDFPAESDDTTPKEEEFVSLRTSRSQNMATAEWYDIAVGAVTSLRGGYVSQGEDSFQRIRGSFQLRVLVNKRSEGLIIKRKQ